MVKIGTVIESPQTGETLIFRSTADSSNGELFRAELFVKPGGYVVRAHIHPSQEESFVVLAGKYGYQIGDRKGVAQAGETLGCPGGVSHSQWNAGDSPRRNDYEHRTALTAAEIVVETEFGRDRDGQGSPKGDRHRLQGTVLRQEGGE
mgnify:CR=1 FL=1